MLPNWESLWSDLVLEEIRRNTRDAVTSRVEEEEKISLVGKGKKVEYSTLNKVSIIQHNSKYKLLSSNVPNSQQ